MRKRSQAIIAAMLALGMAVGMCGCEGQLPTPKATTRQDAPNLSAKQEPKGPHEDSQNARPVQSEP